MIINCFILIETVVEVGHYDLIITFLCEFIIQNGFQKSNLKKTMCNNLLIVKNILRNSKRKIGIRAGYRNGKERIGLS